jgi:hypothetical protein
MRDGLLYAVQVFGDGRIEIALFSMGARTQDQIDGFVVAVGQQRPSPETGSHPQLFYFGGDGGHVAKFCIGLGEVLGFPAVIDHRKRTVVRIRNEFRHHLRRLQDQIAGVISIGEIPIVNTVYR